jgi:hypothetical protein
MVSSINPKGNSAMVRIMDVKDEDGNDVVTKCNYKTVCPECEKRGLQDKCDHIARAPEVLK